MLGHASLIQTLYIYYHDLLVLFSSPVIFVLCFVFIFARAPEPFKSLLKASDPLPSKVHR